MPQSPALNRLRAAAGLLPLIESGLRDGKISRDRAGLMAEFCSWAADQNADAGEVSIKLATEIRDGLERLRLTLS
jgi:hypothetical protein